MNNVDYKYSKVDVIKNVHEDELQKVLNEVSSDDRYGVIIDIKMVGTNGGEEFGELTPADWQYCNIVVFYRDKLYL